MIREIERKPIKYEEYWVMRGVTVDYNGCKTVTFEQEFTTPPTEQDKVDFLINNTQIEFASIEHNFRLISK